MNGLITKERKAASHSMSKRLDKVESLWKLRGIYSDALRAASCLGEFFALGQSHTPLSQRLGTGAPLFRKRRSGYGPAIAQALGLLSSSVPYPPRDGSIVRKVWRKSTR